MSAARICYNCRGPLEPSRKLLCLKCESTNPYEDAKPQDDPVYCEFVEELAAHCTCTPLGERPCAGLLAGGVCDDLHMEEKHTELNFEDENDP